MVVAYTGSKAEPILIPSGATPSFAADIAEITAWLMKGRAFRRFTTQALMNSAASKEDNDIAVVDAIDGAFFKYDGTSAAWVMVGTPRFADSSARATALSAPTVNMRSVLTADEVIYRYNGSAWKAWESDWISYTPVFTNVTVGTGGSPGVTGAYQYVGGRVRDRWSFRLGTSGMSVGSAPTKTLPVTMATPARLFQKLTSEVGYYDDSVPTPYAGVLFAENGSTTVVRLASQSGTAALASITASVPFTWAASDGGAGDWIYDPA